MIEEAIHGKKVGESVVVKMQPDDAFGIEYDAELNVRLNPQGLPQGTGSGHAVRRRAGWR